MKKRFENRIALVTGAGSGIGAMTARKFANEGAQVACADINQEGVAETVETIEKEGGQALAIDCNVANSRSAHAAVEQCIESFGGLGILVNVAGVLKLEHADKTSDEDWNHILGVNLTGTFFMSRAALPPLLEDAYGTIVNVASLAGLKGQAYCAAYCASKAGVVGLTRSMAIEYVKQGLRVNCVCPGGVSTPLIANFAPPDEFDPALIDRLSIVDKITQPKEVADTIAYLASSAARSINGVALPIDFGVDAG